MPKRLSPEKTQEIYSKWHREAKGPGYERVEVIQAPELVKYYEDEIGEWKFIQSRGSAKIQAYVQEMLGHLKRLEGEVNSNIKKTAFTSEELAAENVKHRALELGAEIVGICELDQAFVYQGFTCPHKYAISLGMKMDPTRFADMPYSIRFESIRIYCELGRVTVELAEYIRSLGYAARAHHPLESRDAGNASLVLHLPIAWKAGLGELGRHGSLISPALGSWFRLGTVTTDLPLALGSPKDFGITSFCNSCRLCARHCPGEAISYGPQKISNGVSRWVVETDKCIPYFRNLGSCAICLEVCPMNGRALDQLIKNEWAKDISRVKHRSGKDYQDMNVLDSQREY